jgi:hypothetical protein
MKILVKFPTRSRPANFVKALNGYISNQTTTNVHYLVTIDSDDRSMDNVRDSLLEHDFITVDVGKSYSKIHACNRGLASFGDDWDIVLLASDDMICQRKGWDAQLIEEMTTHFPDTDGVLFHNDGYLGERLNTFCILGRKYFERFGYIYNPEYKSFWCDNEFMNVAQRLGAQKYFPDVLFKHEHPANNGGQMDSLYLQANNDYQTDKQTHEKRKKRQYDIA